MENNGFLEPLYSDKSNASISSSEIDDLDLDPNYHSTPVKQKKLGAEERKVHMDEYLSKIFFRQCNTEQNEINIPTNKAVKRKRVNTKNTRPGTYTTACPNLKIAHHQKTTSKLVNEKFITNHLNLKKPFAIDKTFVQIGNSSILDALLEAFSFSFRYFNTFQSYYFNKNCEKEKENCFFKNIADWCKTGNHNNLYKYIASTLNTIYNEEKKHVLQSVTI